MFQKCNLIGQAPANLITINNCKNLYRKKAGIIDQLNILSSKNFLQIDCNALIEPLEDMLGNDLFNHLLQRLNQPKTGILVDWFFTMLKFISKIPHGKEEKFILAIQLFSKFSDTCFQYHVQNDLVKPYKLPFVFKCSEINYLETCIAALIGSKNKKVQAQLLDQLPIPALVNKAFEEGLPFVCTQMIYNDTVQLHSTNKLEKIPDYENYKSNILVHIAMMPWCLKYSEQLPEVDTMRITNDCVQSRIDFLSCLDFINRIEEVPQHQISLIKKRTLINRFASLIYQFSQLNQIDKFVRVANKLKEIYQGDYCKKIFGSSASSLSDKQLNAYIKVSQYLMVGHGVV